MYSRVMQCVQITRRDILSFEFQLLKMKYVAEILIAFLFGIFSFSVALDEKSSGYNYEESLLYDTFPEDFMWGTATAAYQVKSLVLY